ncbi:GNAT family N-acetyltransferase [Candidatus Latescibacterota bacterium]
MIQIRDMTPADEAFVGSCTHIDETAEWTASCARRVPWLRQMHVHGLRVKVAVDDGEHVGFLYCMPIERAPWGPVGRDLMVIQCLVVQDKVKGHGVGRELVQAAEDEARTQGKRGVAAIAFYHDFWLLPASFYEACGYRVVRRKGASAVMWKAFDSSAEPPDFLEPRYTYTPVAGKVVVDLFWTLSCLTSDTEAQRVREVCAEIGDSVCLREFCAGEPEIRDAAGICRAIYVNGNEIGWGCEAPKEGLREAIEKAMEEA